MDVVLIGAGRLATNLGLALQQSGHKVTCVYSRTLESATALAEQVGGMATNRCDRLPMEADVYIMAVKDAVLSQLIPQVTQGREGQLFVHTAGSMPMTLFNGYACRHGVFYPMQSFSKDRRVDFTVIPLFIEASDPSTLDLLKALAKSISQQVYLMNSDERQYLHLAAVFACNFVNHCYALSADVLERHGLPFDIMLPLIDETARKVHQLAPRDAQTGPAVRYDTNVIDKQRQLLADCPDLQELYERLSRSIHQKAQQHD